MIYECKHCGYTTNRKLNIERHENRKNSCRKTNNGNTNTLIRNYHNEQNIVTNEQNIVINEQNIVTNEQNIVTNKHQCERCKRFFCNKARLDYHIKICKGVDSLTCPICFVRFENSDKKYRHKKKGNCHPPSTTEQPQPILIPQTVYNNINNINTNNSNNTTNNTSNITNNNNIHINIFGKEDIRYLEKDKNIIERLRMFGKKGIYGFSKIIEDIYFNKERPENNTLIKTEEFGNSVMIMNEDQEWEYREIEDIHEEMIDMIIRYFKAYNKVKNDLGIKLIEQREKNILKHFAYEFLALDGYIPREIFDELEMDEDEVENNEEEIYKKVRKFVKSTMKNIHQKTMMNYKKENGVYVKKMN